MNKDGQDPPRRAWRSSGVWPSAQLGMLMRQEGDLRVSSPHTEPFLALVWEAPAAIPDFLKPRLCWSFPQLSRREPNPGREAQEMENASKLPEVGSPDRLPGHVLCADTQDP